MFVHHLSIGFNNNDLIKNNLMIIVICCLSGLRLNITTFGGFEGRGGNTGSKYRLLFYIFAGSDSKYRLDFSVFCTIFHISLFVVFLFVVSYFYLQRFSVSLYRMCWFCYLLMLLNIKQINIKYCFESNFRLFKLLGLFIHFYKTRLLCFSNASSFLFFNLIIPPRLCLSSHFASFRCISSHNCH